MIRWTATLGCVATLLAAMLAVAGCDSRATEVSADARGAGADRPDAAAARATPTAQQEADMDTAGKQPAGDPAGAATATTTTQKATFGAGCFWGVEAEFRKLPGVVSTAVGYEGGTVPNPTYHDVCTDRTGHAEVVEIEFDPSQISYDKLLDTFWELHDPTTLNRQGPDFGSQYRSAVFYHGPEQKAAAEASKRKLEEAGEYENPIVTQIEPATSFWVAEDYHQQYLEKKGLASCHVNLKKGKKH